MRRAQIGDWDSMRMEGILGVVHRLIMLVTFPIRRFWLLLVIFLTVCAVLLIIPLYFGVNVNEVKNWWRQILPQKQMVEAKNYAVEQIAQGENAVKDFAASVVKGTEELLEGEKYSLNEEGEITAKSEKPINSARKYPKWNVAQFEHAQYKPQPKKKLQTGEYSAKMAQTFDMLKKTLHEKLSGDEQIIKNTEVETKVYVPVAAQQHNLTQNEDVSSNSAQKNKLGTDLSVQKEFFELNRVYTAKDFDIYYNRVENRSLLYLREPEILYGRAEINGANSLFVNNKFMFLYGIYSSSRKYDLKKAQEYLQKLTAENMVECVVVAYSAQTGAATALCFVGDVLLNKALVEQGFAENIALK